MDQKVENISMDRRNYHILVTDVHAMGQIGVIRSLGRAGYKVHALSIKEDALGFYSGFSHKICVPPAYEGSEFLPWLQAYIRENNIKLIIPSEGFLWAIQPLFDQLSPLLPLKNDAGLIYQMINKYDYFKAITQSDDQCVRAHCPDLLFITRENMPVDKDMEGMDFPCFIKLDASHGKREADGDGVIKVHTVQEALHQIKLLSQNYSAFIMQSYIPGQKAGVNLLMKDGEVQAHYVMKAAHETPHKGGVASLRHTWQHDEMLEDAIVKLRHLKWDGALMVEYRWDAQTDKFALIEINLRFWGYLHLCLYADVDFPRLLTDDYLGLAEEEKLPEAKQVEARCLSFEVGYLLSLIKDPDESLMRKMAALINFVWVGISFRVFSDSYFPGDRGLWFYEARHTLRNLLRRAP